MSTYAEQLSIVRALPDSLEQEHYHEHDAYCLRAVLARYDELCAEKTRRDAVLDDVLGYHWSKYWDAKEQRDAAMKTEGE